MARASVRPERVYDAEGVNEAAKYCGPAPQTESRLPGSLDY